MIETDNKICFSLTLTEGEYVESQLACLRSAKPLVSPQRQLFMRAGRYLPTVAGVAVVILFAPITSSSKLQMAVALLIFCVLLTPTLSFGADERASRRLRKYLTDKFADDPCHHHDYVISESGLLATCDHGVTDRRWSAFTRTYETGRLLILRMHGGSFYTIPKRVLTEEQLQSLLGIIKTKIGDPIQWTAAS